MYGTHKYGTQKDPKQSRDPAPDDADSGSHDWPRACDRREVMAEDDLLLRRYIINAVGQFLGRHQTFGVEAEDLLAQILAIRIVGDHVADEGDHGD